MLPKRDTWLNDFADPDPWHYIIDAYQASSADDEARLMRAVGRLWNDVVYTDYGGRPWAELARAPLSASAPDAVQPEEVALFVLLIGQVILKGESVVTMPKPPRKRRTGRA